MSLEDFKEKTNYTAVVLGMIFGVAGIIGPLYSAKFKLAIGIICFIVSAISFLFGRKIIKMFSKEFTEQLTLGDSLGMVVNDKDGKIKDIRNSDAKK